MIPARDPFSPQVPELLNHHLEHLKASAISIEVIRERGYKSVLGKTPLKEAGFSKAQQRTPGILIPLYSVDGSSIGYQYRPDNPRHNAKGKPIKYENLVGSSNRLDVPPRCKLMLGDPAVPIFFVEGVKKADALASQGACAIALNGVWGFKGRNPLGGTTLLADFDHIALKEREAFVIYDSDYATNPQVHKAQDRLLEHLKRKGSQANAIYLPSKPNGEKQGVDDFLAAGHTLDDVVALATMPTDGTATTNSQNNYLTETRDGVLTLDIEKLTNDLLNEYRFATLMDTEEILIYNNGVWQAKGEAFIKHECQRRVAGKEGGVSKLLTTYKVSEIIGHIRRATYCDRTRFNRDKWIINLNNGLLDVRNGQLKPHTPQFLSTMRIPVEYNPNADCPRIKQFLREILKPEDIPVIKELFGYCLIPDYSIQRAFLCVGDGANGKSALLNLLKEFIGRDNCSGVPWHALELDRFAKSALEGKLVNMFADIPSQSLNRTGSFKMLTGGDAIGTEKKFKGYFTFSNYARLIFSANKPPKVFDEDSYAFWRRWIVIGFPNEFIGERADKQLLTKLTTKEELSGLLNLALNGLKRLLEQQDFSYAKSVEETTEIYQRAADPIYAFLQDVCESDPEGWMSKEELYQSFKKYCLTNNIPLKKPNSFARALQNQTHLRVKSVRPKIGDSQVAGWQGLKYRDDSEDSEDFPYLKVNKNEDDNNNLVNKIIRKNITNPSNPTIKPVKTCPVCGSSDFWLRPDGAVVCGRCHPKPSRH